MSEHPGWVERATTNTQAQEQTPQHQMMTTTSSPRSPASKLQPSRPQSCERYSRAPPGATSSPDGQARAGTRKGSSRTTAYVLAPSPLLSTSSTRCTNNALYSNHHLHPYSSPTSKEAFSFQSISQSPTQSRPKSVNLRFTPQT